MWRFSQPPPHLARFGRTGWRTNQTNEALDPLANGLNLGADRTNPRPSVDVPGSAPLVVAGLRFCAILGRTGFLNIQGTGPLSRRAAGIGGLEGQDRGTSIWRAW